MTQALTQPQAPGIRQERIHELKAAYAERRRLQRPADAEDRPRRMPWPAADRRLGASALDSSYWLG